MKKFLLTVLLIAVLAVAIVPYFAGIEAEKQFSQVLASYPQNALQLQETDYQRGWFFSTAHTTYLSQATTGLQQQKLVVEHEIWHALPPYFETVIQSTVLSQAEPETTATQQQFTAQVEPVLIHTVVQTNGDTVSKIRMPAVDLQRSADKTAVQWQNLETEIHTTNQFQQVQNRLQVPQLNYGSAGGQLSLQDLALNANLQQGFLDFLIGEGDLKIRQIELQSPVLKTTQLHNLAVQWRNMVEGENLALVMDGNLANVQIGQQNYGPGHMQLEVNGLHAPSLRALQDRLAAAKAASSGQTLMIMGALMQYLPTIMSHQPTLTIKQFEFDSPDGRSQGTLQVGLAPKLSTPINLFQPQTLLNLLNAEFDLQLPEKALHNLIIALLELPVTDPNTLPQVKQQVQTWLANGWLVEDEDTHFYRTKAQLENGMLEINEQQIPLNQWL